MRTIALSGYVLMDRNGEFIALDPGSGGYPYSTTFARAHVFETVHRALEYRRDEPWAIVRRVHAVVEDVDISPFVDAREAVREAQEHLKALEEKAKALE